MKNGEQIKSIAVLVAGSFALVFVIYNFLQSFREDGLYSIEIRKRKKQLNIKGKNILRKGFFPRKLESMNYLKFLHFWHCYSDFLKILLHLCCRNFVADANFEHHFVTWLFLLLILSGDLPNLLTALEEDEIEKTNLLFVLSKLTDLAAFTDIQVRVTQNFLFILFWKIQQPPTFFIDKQ